MLFLGTIGLVFLVFVVCCRTHQSNGPVVLFSCILYDTMTVKQQHATEMREKKTHRHTYARVSEKLEYDIEIF